MRMENKEEKKRETPEGLIMQIAACPFCGQTRIREGVAVEVSEEEMEEYAKRHCDCDEAKHYQDRVRRLDLAKHQIAGWFEDEDPEFIETAMNIVHMVQKWKMDNAVMVNNSGKKLKIGTSSTGNLKVEVTQTMKASRVIK